MKILFLGDIVGSVGRAAVKQFLPALVSQLQPDLVIANAENAAGGLGTDPKTAKEILSCGVQILTGGNHTWKHRSYIEYLENNGDIAIRPLNFPDGAPGQGNLKGERSGESFAVVNLIGRVFMPQLVDCPFECAESILSSLENTAIKIFDFHAEATSEKVAMGHFLAGKATLVVGTHTHVQTADETILPGGTAYITDLGMCGAKDSVIGMQKEPILRKFRYGLPERFKLSEGPPMLNGVFIEANDKGHALNIKRINIS